MKPSKKHFLICISLLALSCALILWTRPETMPSYRITQRLRFTVDPSTLSPKDVEAALKKITADDLQVEVQKQLGVEHGPFSIAVRKISGTSVVLDLGVADDWWMSPVQTAVAAEYRYQLKARYIWVDHVLPWWQPFQSMEEWFSKARDKA
jgi:hypothetical protein